MGLLDSITPEMRAQRRKKVEEHRAKAASVGFDLTAFVRKKPEDRVRALESFRAEVAEAKDKIRVEDEAIAAKEQKIAVLDKEEKEKAAKKAALLEEIKAPEQAKKKRNSDDDVENHESTGKKSKTG